MDRCRHPACTCPATADSAYCSASCAQAANGAISPIGCGCGHAACAMEKKTETGRREVATPQ